MTLRLSGLTSILRASIAPFLLLITPFASYLEYNRLGITNPEVILAVLAIASAYPYYVSHMPDLPLPSSSTCYRTRSTSTPRAS